MSRSVSRPQAPISARPASRSDLTLFQVVRYDPQTHKALEIFPVEAGTKAEAAQKSAGSGSRRVPPKAAIASAMSIGDQPKQREYFRRA